MRSGTTRGNGRDVLTMLRNASAFGNVPHQRRPGPDGLLHLPNGTTQHAGTSDLVGIL
jgi:hypothetical protein